MEKNSEDVQQVFGRLSQDYLDAEVSLENMWYLGSCSFEAQSEVPSHMMPLPPPSYSEKVSGKHLIE